CLLDASLGRFSGHVPPGGHPGEDPGHAGETMSLSWPGNALGSSRKSWRKCLGTGKSGHLCVEGVNEAVGAECSRRPDLSMIASRLDNEEATVSQLLQSLRNKTQKGERLQTRNLNGCLTQLKLDEAEGMKKNLQDRCREVEQDVATLKSQLVEKQAVQAENERLKLQLGSMQAQVALEQRKAEEERKNLAQLKDAYTKLFEDYNELKEEKKKRELVEKEQVEELQQRLAAAEEALAVKQSKIDEMKQDMFQKEKELETISVFQAQAEVYSSDFYAERAAREKLHEEKERLATQLEYIKKQNSQLQEEMDSLGRRSLNEMQRRHVAPGGSPHGAGPALVGRGAAADWQHQENIPEHACPNSGNIFKHLTIRR
uniref:Optineurin n=1 Tax=Salarias fasciatus TaxID=181472 RepID=A0A672J4N9_SALFA